MSAPAEPRNPAAPVTVGRILLALITCLLALHVAQALADGAALAEALATLQGGLITRLPDGFPGSALLYRLLGTLIRGAPGLDRIPVGAIAFAAVGAGMVGWGLPLLRSVRTAVVLLVLLSAACVLGTLTVQRPQLTHADEAAFRETAEFAWAHLLYKISHPLPAAVTPPEDHAQTLERLALVFGDEVADEERESLVKRLKSSASEAAARELASAHPALFRTLFRIANTARLTDLFHAWWFVGLFYLLVANLLFGALVRRKVSLRNVGFHGAHLGLVLVVLGATVGAYTGQRGILPMEVGQSSAAFTGETPAGQQPLGFAIRLDDFETHYHEDLVIEALAYTDPHQGSSAHGGMGHGSTRPLRHTVKLEEGASLSLTDPETGEAYELTLAEITEAAALRRELGPVAAGDGGEGVPALALETGGAAQAFGLTDPVWLSGDDPLYIDPANRYKVRLEAWAGGEPPAALGLDCEVGAGTLTLAEDGGEPHQARIVEGGSFELGRFRGTAEEVVPDFRVGEIPPGPAGFPRNPALRVQLADETGESGRFLMFSDPRLKGFTELPWEGVQASFDYDYWCSPSGAWIRMLVAPDGDAVAVVILPAGSLTGDEIEDTGSELAVEIRAGSELTLPGLEMPLIVAQVLGAAAESTELVGVEQAAAEGLEVPARTALRLRIDGPSGTDERWLLSNTEQGVTWLGREATGDDAGSAGFGIALADNTDRPPRDWRSHVTFLEEGSEVGSGVMEVNSPAKHAGFAFFQSDANAQRPDYSGLSVVRDPSWLLVKAGLWLLLLGISWCFYVQPLFDRRARAARRAATPGA